MTSDTGPTSKPLDTVTWKQRLWERVLWGLFVVPFIGAVEALTGSEPVSPAAIAFLVAFEVIVVLLMRRARVWPFAPRHD